LSFHVRSTSYFLRIKFIFFMLRGFSAYDNSISFSLSLCLIKHRGTWKAPLCYCRSILDFLFFLHPLHHFHVLSFCRHMVMNGELITAFLILWITQLTHEFDDFFADVPYFSLEVHLSSISSFLLRKVRLSSHSSYAVSSSSLFSQAVLPLSSLNEILRSES
jgi:hypothetical protein